MISAFLTRKRGHNCDPRFFASVFLEAHFLRVPIHHQRKHMHQQNNRPQEEQPQVAPEAFGGMPQFPENGVSQRADHHVTQKRYTVCLENEIHAFPLSPKNILQKTKTDFNYKHFLRKSKKSDASALTRTRTCPTL